MRKHYEQATRDMDSLVDDYRGNVPPQFALASAQAHATLALAEEQRTANMIAVLAEGFVGDTAPVVEQIKERLGL